jgi:putative flavoprotein involved in K+ transport
MSMPEVIALFERYAARSHVPIQSHTRVLQLVPSGSGYRARTDDGEIFASNVVIATGYSDVAARPQLAASLNLRVHQLTPSLYRNPQSVPDGGVLVVGASASGAQIADELARSGREVTLAVGRHTRLPRRYRGADIMFWLDRTGALDQTLASVRNPEGSKRQRSLQLIGSDPARDLDLSAVARSGVRIAGRLMDVAGDRVCFEPDLTASIQRADEKLDRVLRGIDQYIDTHGWTDCAGMDERPAPIDPTRFPSIRRLNLASAGISTVIWATGYRRDYRWLQVPIFGADHEIVHTRGITAAPGVYTMGLYFQHTRKSNFIDGVAADAEYIVRDIAARLGVRESFAA